MREHNTAGSTNRFQIALAKDTSETADCDNDFFAIEPPILFRRILTLISWAICRIMIASYCVWRFLAIRLTDSSISIDKNRSFGGRFALERERYSP
jgi:hypothetical protein